MLQIRTTLPRHLTAGEIFSGYGSVSALAVLGGLRTVVLCTQSVYSNEDLITIMKKSIGSISLHFICLPKGEPNLELLKPILSKLNEINPDYIIAVGGGATIDSSKILWLMYEIPNANLELYQRPYSLPPLRIKAKFIAIPTTAGSGSEVSSVAVYAYNNQNIKHFIVSHELIPDIAILDPQFLITLPRKIFVNSCMDALSHALEGYINTTDNLLMDMYAETVARTIFIDLPLLYKNWKEKNDESEEMKMLLTRIMNAAMLGGNIQNFKVPGIGHAFSHQLGKFGISHGLGCAIMLPIAMEVNASDTTVRKKYNKLASNIGYENFDRLLNQLTSLKKSCQVPKNLTELGLRSANQIKINIDDILFDLKSDVCFKMNPKELDNKDLETILFKVLG